MALAWTIASRAIYLALVRMSDGAIKKKKMHANIETLHSPQSQALNPFGMLAVGCGHYDPEACSWAWLVKHKNNELDPALRLGIRNCWIPQHPIQTQPNNVVAVPQTSMLVDVS